MNFQKVIDFLEGQVPTKKEGDRVIEKICTWQAETAKSELWDLTALDMSHKERLADKDIFRPDIDFFNHLEKIVSLDYENGEKINGSRSDNWSDPETLINVYRLFLSKNGYKPPRNNLTGIQIHLWAIYLYYEFILPHSNLTISQRMQFDHALLELTMVSSFYRGVASRHGSEIDISVRRTRAKRGPSFIKVKKFYDELSEDIKNKYYNYPDKMAAEIYTQKAFGTSPKQHQVKNILREMGLVRGVIQEK